jgi:hypothetical protein
MNNTFRFALYLLIVCSAVGLPIAIAFIPKGVNADVVEVLKQTASAFLPLVGFIVRDIRNRDPKANP